MRFRAAVLASSLSACALLAARGGWQSPPSGKDVVSPEAVVSFDPVARGKSFQIAVVMKIRPGFHVNAREVSADYLIPTELRSEIPAGFKAGEVAYPKGTLRTFAFSKDKQLNVYTGSVILRLPVTALPDAPRGAGHFPLKLHYQACSDEICLPPVTLPVEAIVNVTDSPDSARAVRSDIFPK